MYSRNSASEDSVIRWASASARPSFLKSSVIRFRPSSVPAKLQRYKEPYKPRERRNGIGILPILADRGAQTVAQRIAVNGVDPLKLKTACEQRLSALRC